MNSETSAQLKLKVLNVSKRELFKDLDRAVEFDQSQSSRSSTRTNSARPAASPTAR